MKKLVLVTMFVFTYLLLISKDGDPQVAFTQFYDVQPNVENCVEGYITETEKQKVIQIVNEIRERHNLEPIYYDDAYDSRTAKSSLIMAKNKALSHTPPTSWGCYSAEGYEGAEHTNLYISQSSGSSWNTTESSIVSWMIDQYTPSVGHRRWIIDPFLKFVSMGRADWNDGQWNTTAMSLWVISDDKLDASKIDVDYVAYPFENYKPEWVYYGGSNFHYLSFTAIFDKNNYWNNQNVDYSNASVKMELEDGTNVAIAETIYDNDGYGVPNCLKWKPATLSRDTKYNVTISNVRINGQPREYTYWFKLTDIDQSTPPEVPTLANPANEAKGIATNTSLSWNVAQRANAYHVQLSSDENFNTILEENPNAVNLYFQTTSLEEKSSYYWRVKAKNDAGESDWSEVWSFTTRGGAPQKVALLKPDNGDEEVEFPFEIEWQEDPNAESYTFQVADQEDFGGFSIIISRSTYNDTKFTIEENDIDYDKAYYWRVRSVTSGGLGDWSDVWSFIVSDGSSVNEAGKLIAYPNPARDVITIPIRELHFVADDFRIFDAQGKLIGNFKISNQTNEIIELDISNLESGKYYYEILNSNQNSSGSFVITK